MVLVSPISELPILSEWHCMMVSSFSYNEARMLTNQQASC